MFNATVKGKVVLRKSLAENESKDVVALVVLAVSLFQFGQRVTVYVECWLPAYLKSRKEFLMKQDNAYLLLVLDGLVDVSPNTYENRSPVMAGMISQIYLG